MELYKCPIEVFKCTSVIDAFDDLSRKIAETFDNEVINEVHKVDIKVNKDELLKALEYDRGQYEKGYADAKSEYEPKRGEWIVEGKSAICSECGYNDLYENEHMYCATVGERFANFCPNCGADMRKEK